MAPFQRLIRFQSKEDGSIHYADIGSSDVATVQGTRVQAYASLEALSAKASSNTLTVDRLLAPVPNPNLPIYCVGLNYRSHAEEAGLKVPKQPPLWTKPAASLASPGEDIPVGKFCAEANLDYEGELVFVTSKTAKNITPEQAPEYILGYTVGNDISCRTHQAPENCGWQFYFAKAFDKFAPMGPVLLNPEALTKDVKLVTKVNGDVVQESKCLEDMIFSINDILSWMSQETTIPAGTAVMTGTPAGVGLFRKPQLFLKDSDVVEIELAGAGAGVLKNKIVVV
ncbi:hypothetical protein PRZ48_014633 [Zasmidium cellare]|uniref:Fumarylacetoacetase-like C-terminal domain-containing protein n=1 Tax=Zasmidium cellare TaxID=395010 RepID=A0ABR0DZ99_ZASCE|nr:hypothetical protein PRZ48_014633 [Zasmidium cellare]